MIQGVKAIRNHDQSDKKHFTAMIQGVNAIRIHV